MLKSPTKSDIFKGKRAAGAKITLFAPRDEKNRMVCLIRRSRI